MASTCSPMHVEGLLTKNSFEVDGIKGCSLNAPDDHSRDSALEELINQSYLETDALKIENDWSCLVCSDNFLRNQPIWSCLICYHIFHLKCIQFWARRTFDNDDFFSWKCPYCNWLYTYDDTPIKYLCFCGKLENPPIDPWIRAHSCGKPCDRILKCSHSCNILCHSGSCPPCAKTTDIKCFCERAGTKVQRCGKNKWCCGEECLRILNCEKHYCSFICHEGPCPPCSISNLTKCQCGRQEKYLRCENIDWKCDSICNSILFCGNHRCEERCHPLGHSHPCQRALSRCCPCGKVKNNLSCLEDTPLCGNTCSLILNCGSHKCENLCHFGTCSPCKLLVAKICRCGKTRRKINCASIVKCEYKCQKFRNCLRHLCRRKCCSGDCFPCRENCNRTLSCGRHRCHAPCHPGQCYPCMEKLTLLCACGGSKKLVLCDRRNYSSSPICKLLCRKISLCLHKSIPNHPCHSGACPPCNLICNKPYQDCIHACTSQCHSIPSFQQNEICIEEGPWKLKKYVNQCMILNCPPCNSKVYISCDGGHVLREQECSNQYSFSCDLLCGMVLACERHKCERLCHKIDSTNIHNISKYNCQYCVLECDKKRPEGCSHKCKLICHPKDCPPCVVKLKHFCHCGSLELEYTCNYWTTLIGAARVFNSSCRGRCKKVLLCGHRCAKNCHSGMCSSSDDCSTKITLHCKCGGNTKKIICKDAYTVECGYVCQINSLNRIYQNKEVLIPLIKGQKRKNTYRRKTNQNGLMNFNLMSTNNSNTCNYSRWYHKNHYCSGLLFFSVIIIIILLVLRTLLSDI